MLTKETLTLILNGGIGGCFVLLVYFIKRLVDQHDKFREATEKSIGYLRRDIAKLRCEHSTFKARVETHLEHEE